MIYSKTTAYKTSELPAVRQKCFYSNLFSYTSFAVKMKQIMFDLLPLQVLNYAPKSFRYNCIVERQLPFLTYVYYFITVIICLIKGE